VKRLAGNILAQVRHRKYYRKRPYFAHEFCDAEPPTIPGDKPLYKPTFAWDFWMSLCCFSVPLSRTGHVGERAAAALHASRLLCASGLTWGDLLGSPVAEPSAGDPWRQQAIEAGQFADLLTAWERNFLRKLAGFPAISEKQRDILQQIIAKVQDA